MGKGKGSENGVDKAHNRGKRRKGVVFGNSGGKDCALTGILCKAACPEKTIGVIMPCESKQNYTSDSEDAKRLADKFGIETRTVDITEAKRALTSAARHALNAADAETVKKSTANVNPRLRMTTLYLIAQTEGCLVAGTGNRSENTMGISRNGETAATTSTP